jgi:bifunctional ADP-heptose synthase (sugar kinase/adenylyltransferase)
VDTRNKIISYEKACALAADLGEPLLVLGYFDVLLAAHARELAQLRDRRRGGPLLVAVLSPDGAVLDARARSEMVAALAMVDYVVNLDGQQAAQLAAALPPERIVHLEAAHEQRMRELIEHVRRRHSQ